MAEYSEAYDFPNVTPDIAEAIEEEGVAMQEEEYQMLEEEQAPVGEGEEEAENIDPSAENVGEEMGQEEGDDGGQMMMADEDENQGEVMYEEEAAVDESFVESGHSEGDVGKQLAKTSDGSTKMGMDTFNSMIETCMKNLPANQPSSSIILFNNCSFKIGQD